MSSRIGVPVVENVSAAELYEVISTAASLDPARVQASSKRLKEMLDMSGTFNALHEIAAQRNLPLQIRQQSIIQFKNAALPHWRSRKLLSNEERTNIRARCFAFFTEEDDLISQCNEVIMAKIARQDFPNSWPDLVSNLMSTIDTNLQTRYTSLDLHLDATLILRRALKVLDEILKEFASIKMLYGIKTLGQITQQLHSVMYSYYSKMSAGLADALNPSTISSVRVADDLLLAHLVYKCLTKMASWLWSRSDRTGKDEFDKLEPWLHELFHNSAIQMQALTETRINLIISLRSAPSTPDPTAGRSINQLTRHVRLFGKFFRRLQQLAAHRFIALPTCSEVVLYYWSKVVQATNGPPELVVDSDEAVFPVRFIVQGMVLFKESLAQWAPQKRDGTPNTNTLSQEFVENAVRLLVTRFIPLNPSDLEGWMSDPEEWVNLEDKENEQWEYELRPCGERVLMTLAAQYKDYVTPLLLTTFNQAIAQPTVDLPAVIQKEALYCAIGRCAGRLKDLIPFDQWLEHTLIAEVRETNSNYPIIKRRIAWLIQKWVGDGCTSPNNSKIWEILLYLLQDRGPGTDAVVRLTAVVALRECIEVVNVDSNVFAPFLSSIVTELVRLLGDAETIESKRRICGTLNSVIERSQSLIIPLMGTITAPLPQLWMGAGEEWPLKASLLGTVTRLVNSVGEQSTPLAAIVVPLVRESLSPGVISHLDEDALVLWLAALRNAVTIQIPGGGPALFDLFPIALSLLSTNLDLLGKITDIIESYFLLDGALVMQVHGVNVLRAFHTALNNDAVATNMKDMILKLNTLVQITAPPLWGEPMHVSGLFAHLLTSLIDNVGGTILLTEYIYVLARVVMVDRLLFLQLMAATAVSQKKPESDLYESLLDQWWRKFDNMSEPRHRKLAAMGIASLVATGRPEVLSRLSGEIFNLWLDVFGEIKESQVDNSGEDGESSELKRFWDRDDPPHSYFRGTELTPEYNRRKAVYDNDPVRTTQLSSYVQARLMEGEAACGASVFQNTYLKKADPTVLKQLQDELRSR